MDKLLITALLATIAWTAMLPLRAVGSSDTTIYVLWPAGGTSQRSVNHTVTEDAGEPHITRVGPVVLAADVFLPLLPKRGKREASVMSFLNVPFSVAFFPDEEYQIIIDSDIRLGPDAMTLGGRLAGHDLASFTLTVTGESYLITLQDIFSALLYRVVGTTETGLGTVTEIDLTQTPPIDYLPPIVAEP
jgi:hypothetical protein